MPMATSGHRSTAKVFPRQGCHVGAGLFGVFASTTQTSHIECIVVVVVGCPPPQTCMHTRYNTTTTTTTTTNTSTCTLSPLTGSCKGNAPVLPAAGRLFQYISRSALVQSATVRGPGKGTSREADTGKEGDTSKEGDTIENRRHRNTETQRETGTDMAFLFGRSRQRSALDMVKTVKELLQKLPKDESPQTTKARI